MFLPFWNLWLVIMPNSHLKVIFWLLVYKSFNDIFKKFSKNNSQLSWWMFLPYVEWCLTPSARVVHPAYRVETPLCCMTSFNAKPPHLYLRYFDVFSLHLTDESNWTECKLPFCLQHFTTFGKLWIVSTRRKNQTWCFFDAILFTEMVQNAISINTTGNREETAVLS